MRILAAADIHGALEVYDWLGEAATRHKTELLLLAGDLFSGGWEHEQAAEAPRIIASLRRVPCPVLYLMGNDDFIALDHNDDHIRSLHVQRVELGGFAFAGYQYTPQFMGTVFERTETAIEDDTRALEALLDGQTVFVTHAPVFGVLDRVDGGRRVGSRALGELLARRPVLAHIHGHIHECFGREGNHFNVAAAAQRQAVLIDLPSLTHQVLVA